MTQGEGRGKKKEGGGEKKDKSKKVNAKSQKSSYDQGQGGETENDARTKEGGGEIPRKTLGKRKNQTREKKQKNIDEKSSFLHLAKKNVVFQPFVHDPTKETWGAKTTRRGGRTRRVSV